MNLDRPMRPHSEDVAVLSVLKMLCGFDVVLALELHSDATARER